MVKNLKKGKIVACLDMGSSKLVCTIAAIHGDDIHVLGYSHKESKGIVAGAISDMNLAQKAITAVVSEAEKMAGFNIDKLLIGISGSHVISSRKEVSIKIASDTVKSSDIASLADKIRVEFNKNNREIIHLIPLQYRIDDSVAVANPRFMTGERLYAKFHIISTSQTTIKNIENCLKRCQLSVNNYVVEPDASAIACLSENEMNLGTLLIDLGGSSTSFCIISEGKLMHVGSSAIGGSHTTRDISTILNINFETAEKVKNLNSSLIISPLEEKEIIRLKISDPNDGPNMIRITRSQLRDIINSRLEEIFESVKTSLENSGINFHLLSNIVITGGVSSIVGIDKVASEILEKNVRIGYPHKVNGIRPELLSPAHSCVVGMLIFLKNLYLKENIKDGFEVKSGWFKKFIEKLAAV